MSTAIRLSPSTDKDLDRDRAWPVPPARGWWITRPGDLGGRKAPDADARGVEVGSGVANGWAPLLLLLKRGEDSGMASLFGCSFSFLLRAADALDGFRLDDVAAVGVEEEAVFTVEGPADDDAAAPGVEVEAPEVEGPATAPTAVATPVGCFLPLDGLSPAATLGFLP